MPEDHSAHGKAYGEDAERRSGIRLNCPHCQNPIAIVDDSEEDEVLCPTCGSQFRVDPDRTEVGAPEKLRSIGKFDLLEIVGRGAFGTVYRARDTELDRIVAVKVPRSGTFATDEDEDRFVREARSVAQLNHPGIVPVYEVGRSESYPYIVTEFVSGLTLQDKLTGPRFGFREAAALVAGVAEGLDAAHRQGVIHRDLKPANIMLEELEDSAVSSSQSATDSGRSSRSSTSSMYGSYIGDVELGLRPRLLDFGLARRDEGEITVTFEGQVLGTPAYMSPEQARGESHRVDGRSDVYSLGVILYELLAGELPFRGNSRMLLHQVLHEEPRPPRLLNHRIPRDLQTICLKCLQKEPKRRYRDAAELHADLRRWLTGEPITARPVGEIERLWRWSKRNPRVAILSAALILALLGGMIGVTTQWQRAEKNATRYQEEADRNMRLAAQERKAREAAQEEKLMARRNQYISDMNLAWQAWDEHNLRRAVKLLESHRPASPEDNDFRHFEWYCLWRLCHPDTKIFHHGSPVTSVAFSPDGSLIASGSREDRTVKVWNCEAGDQVATLQTEAPVLSVAFFPDGRELVATSESGVKKPLVKVRDVESGRCLHVLEGHSDWVSSARFSPIRNSLATASRDGTIKLWDLETGNEATSFLWGGQPGPIWAMTFSPDGELLVVGGKERFQVWNLKTSTELLSLSNLTRSNPYSVAFSPNGRLFAYGSPSGSCKVCEVSGGDERANLVGHANAVASVTFSPDGTTLASGSYDQTIRLWDMESGSQTGVLIGHAGHVRRVAFSPDGRLLASASSDGTVRVWNVECDAQADELLGHISQLRDVEFSPDGRLLASAGIDGTLRLWSAENGRLLNTIETGGPLYCAAFAPDGNTIATGDNRGGIKSWDVQTCNERDIGTGRHGDRVFRLAYSPDGRFLASGGLGEGYVWTLGIKSDKKRLQMGDGFEGAVAFSPDTSLLAGAVDGGVQFWITENWRESFLLPEGNNGREIAFSPDGKTIAAAFRDESIRLWDVETGHLQATLAGHRHVVDTVAFTPDGTRLASGSWDETIKIWDLATFRQVATLKAPFRVHSIAFSPDGKILASAGASPTIRLWRTATDDDVTVRAKMPK